MISTTEYKLHFPRIQKTLVVSDFKTFQYICDELAGVDDSLALLDTLNISELVEIHEYEGEM